jgi:hypothetical protein
MFLNIKAQVDSVKDALNYYPLHIGDYWQYKMTRDSSNDWNLNKTWTGYKEVIGDTVIPNNKRYFKMKVVGISTNMFETHESPDRFNMAYVRIDSSTTAVYQYIPPTNEIVIDSLLVKKGSEICRLAICTDITYKSYFGISSVITKSLRNALVFDDFGFNWDIAYGLGELKRSYYITDPYAIDFQNILTYAKINNVEYGTKVDVTISEKLPIQAVLYQNYPNPFNPVTTIDYSVPKIGFVTIKVYDILGREVMTLLNENKLVGNYNVEFNASKLVSGVYFYRMQAGDFVQTKKLILLK